MAKNIVLVYAARFAVSSCVNIHVISKLRVPFGRQVVVFIILHLNFDFQLGMIEMRMFKVFLTILFSIHTIETYNL
jgi:hypothetical protein